MSGRMLDDGVTAGLTEVELKKVPIVDEKRDWTADSYEHDPAAHEDGTDGAHPSEDEMHGPRKLRRVSDKM